METTIQKKLFATKDDFLAYRAAFKEIARAKELTAKDMMMHNILRGRAPEFGFTPITKQTRIDSGHKSRHVQVRWELWNDVRRAKQYNSENFYPYVPVKLSQEIWEHVYSVLQH